MIIIEFVTQKKWLLSSRDGRVFLFVKRRVELGVGGNGSLADPNKLGPNNLISPTSLFSGPTSKLNFLGVFDQKKNFPGVSPS